LKKALSAFSAVCGASHALVTVPEALGHEPRAIVALQRFLAGDANRFGQCQP